MQMPSLFKYFALVGAALFGLLSLANFLLDPSTGATPVASTPKPVIAVQHDPRASKIERWRDDQAALKAAQQTPATGSVTLAVKSTPVATPARPTPEAYRSESAAVAQAVAPVTQAAAPQPAEPVAAAQTEPKPQPVIAAADTTAIVGVETAEEAAVARAQAAERKAKVAKAKAKKERLAREQAAGQQRTASNQQDQYYYGQRGSGQQPFTTRYSSAYAPQQQSFGPFGWGRGW